MSARSDDVRARVVWMYREADECEQVGAHRLAAWWRAEAKRLRASV